VTVLVRRMSTSCPLQVREKGGREGGRLALSRLALSNTRTVQHCLLSKGEQGNTPVRQAATYASKEVKASKTYRNQVGSLWDLQPLTALLSPLDWKAAMDSS
jgi:hypothetical protein